VRDRGWRMVKELVKYFGDDNLVEVCGVSKAKRKLLFRVIIDGEKSAR